MPRRPPLLLVPLAALLTGSLGCVIFPWEEAVIYQALDYTIDHPRLLAVDVDPPLLAGGQPVRLDALFLSPGGDTPTSVSWSTCGLRTDIWVYLYSLECFSVEEEILPLGEGLPATWTPPVLDIPTDTAWGGNSSFLPFLLEARFGDEVVRGTFHASLYGSVKDYGGGVPTSFHDMPLTVTAGPVEDGQVALEAVLGDDQPNATFRWYVDDGQLLDTGRTAVQERTGTAVVGRNRWVVPEEPGSYRVAVVVSALDSGAPWGKPPDTDQAGDTGHHGPDTWWNGEVPSMAWTVITVEVP